MKCLDCGVPIEQDLLAAMHLLIARHDGETVMLEYTCGCMGEEAQRLSQVGRHWTTIKRCRAEER